MSIIPQGLKSLNGVKAVFAADTKGTVIEQYKAANAQKVAAVGAYASHCLKSVEENLGMLELKSIKVSGSTKKLTLNFQDDYLFVVESNEDVPENLIAEYFEEA